VPRNDEFLTGAFKQESPNEKATSYVYGTGENSLGTQSGAQVVIRHPRTFYEDPIRYRKDFKFDENGKVVTDEQNNPVKENWIEHNKVKPGEQIPLYNVNHKPPVLHFLVSTKDARSKASGLAAHAVEDTRRRFGERPVSSDSTSTYSTPLVNKAIEDGIIKGVEGMKPGEKAEGDNGYGFMDSISTMNNLKAHAPIINEALNNDTGFDRWYDRRYSKIPESSLQFDKESIAREAIANRNAKNPKPKKSKGEQLELPQAPFGHK
jgi:hypothetical protein